MKRIFSYLLLLLTSQTITSQTFSQDEKIIPPSPKAQTIMRYGEIPVGYETGVPDITIPLYTIKSGDIEVPITLSYHIRNVRPGYDVSDVALGWTLNFGGQIVRTIYGTPDDAAIDPPVKYTFDQLDQNIWEHVNYLYDCLLNSYDTEHDVFSIGSTLLKGSFILDRKSVNDYDPHWMTCSNLKIKVSTKQDNRSYSKYLINNIDVMDEHGIKYEFGNDMIETCLSPGSTFGITSWLLKKITDASGKYTVQYNYVKTPQESRFGSEKPSYAQITGDNTKKIEQQWGTWDKLSIPIHYSCVENLQGASLVRDGMIISEIAFSCGKILFDIDITNNVIHGFRVVDNANNVVRRVVFVTSNFSPQSFNNHKRLDAVRIYGASLSDAKMEEYKFSYNGGVMDDKMCGNDFWGYYNGAAYSCTKRNYTYRITEYNTEWPLSENIVTLGSNDRKPSEQGSLCETLNKITYPTKGETEFEFELNTCTNSGSTNGVAGGLRIKSIKNKAKDGKLEVKEYFYEDGIVDHNVTELSNFRTTTFGLSSVYPKETLYENNYYISRNRTFSNRLRGELGSNEVRYGKVTEVFSDNTSSYGKNIYYFGKGIRNDYRIYHSDIEGDEGNLVLCTRRDENNGFLIRKEMYKKNPQGDFSIVKEETNNWGYIKDGIFKNYKMFRLVTFLESDIWTEWHYRKNFQETLNPTEFDDLKIFGLYQYDIITGQIHNFGTTTTTYAYSGTTATPTTTSVTYHYDNPQHCKPTSISTISSTGKQIVKKMMYPLDYNSNLTNLISKNIHNPISSTTYVDGKLIKGTLTKYNAYGQPTEIYEAETELGTPFSADKNNPYNWGSLRTMFTYLPNSDLIQTHHMGNHMIQDVCYLWSYNGTYPIAEIKNATYSEINSLLGESNIVNFSNKVTPSLSDIQTFLKPLLSNTKYMITYYSYKPLLGMMTKTDPNGVTTYFDYDSFGRLYEISDHGKHTVTKYHYQYKH